MSKSKKSNENVNEFKLLFIVLFILISGSLFFSIYGIYLQNKDDKCELKDKDEIKEKCINYIDDLYNAVLIHFDSRDVYNVTFAYDVRDRIDYSSKNLDLYINGDYVLKFDDGDSLSFDTLGSYALYNNEVVMLDKETWITLERLIKPVDSNECCSCCPDLKPGESCIALCCPCAS